MSVRGQAEADLKLVQVLRDRNIPKLLDALAELIERERCVVSEHDLDRLKATVKVVCRSAANTHH